MNDDLEIRLFFTFDFSKPFKEAKKNFLKRYVRDILAISLGNVSMAAKKANLDRRHFYRIITGCEINPQEQRKELLKPNEYMKETISEIFSNDSIDDISKVIVESLNNITYDDALVLFEKMYIEESLKNNNYNLHETASKMDVSERTLQRKIGKYSIAC